MKLFALLLAFTLVASSAAALIDDGTESLGVYFDQAGDQNCGVPPLLTPFTIYFIMARPAVPSIGAFELHWRYRCNGREPDVLPTILALNLPAGALNIGDQYNMIVGLGLGLPTAEATILASADLMMTTALPAITYIQVGPTVPASHPGFISYVGFADPEIIRHMDVSCGEVDASRWSIPGVASVPCYVATESETFSGIKALFQ